MIISRTPVRVSFLGGGSDYPEYCRDHTGMTLCATIDKYSYITVNSLSGFFGHNIRISYSKTELAKTVPTAIPTVRLMRTRLRRHQASLH